MEPTLMTEPRLVDILQELVLREPLFHRPEAAATRLDFEKMITPEFREIGASGRRYSRDTVLEILEDRIIHPLEEPWEARDFHCLEIAPDHYLLTYTLLQTNRVTRRATIWRKSEGRWVAVFHQGTIVEDL
ncbi:MAG: DUF4440 domain-containing protein [Ignavibacteriae bacterium]|nr:MAG: DUF4440 domain-containing protein [Ignavibacteriota bacterium]